MIICLLWVVVFDTGIIVKLLHWDDGKDIKYWYLLTHESILRFSISYHIHYPVSVDNHSLCQIPSQIILGRGHFYGTGGSSLPAASLAFSFASLATAAAAATPAA